MRRNSKQCPRCGTLFSGYLCPTCGRVGKVRHHVSGGSDGV